MSDDSRLYKRTIVKDEVTSVLLGETRPLRIYLPPGYNELLSYPVIYCQDGEQFFNFGRIATTLTRLILDEDLEPAIVVGVDVNIANRTSEYAPEGERHDLYCQFFAEELLPYIENRYPVRQERTERILAGDSLGGTVSLHLALDYPSLFCRVISLSGAFFDITRERIKSVDDLSWLELYMLIGLDETDVTTERGTFDFVRENRLTQTLLQDKNAALHYIEKPGKHIWGFWQLELPATLHYFLG
ncbi:alpha/beta hydrolase [Paenibacillus roseipurpureus]|uniref:Alpha/beta hydrolase-fold protein n=1 Tax=Paenibacillus roseopurpureus TaxID=2918901 RepID=A0AA96LWF0_9BACL|nr:alpha/beta hydrolase-fold protein [Paenibacillus sp. MBLB1832]WNR45910.1 alpha/beta hydrolase-fold protein [Paenibacillus sp. MBLB1832]